MTNLPLVLLLQDSAAGESQNTFFGWISLVWVIVPFAVLILLARSRRRAEPARPHVSDADFASEVLGSATPVLVHFYRTWSIGDRVMINQARRLAERNRDALKVVWLDVDLCPETVSGFSHIETPAFLFFHAGKCLFHCEGVVDEADVHREIWDAHARFERRRLASVGTAPGAPAPQS